MNCLNMDVEKELNNFIQEKMKNENLETIFPNRLLREDVLDLLERFCIVIYYPLSGEENNGFHVNDMPLGGENREFVFINTAQTMEKQVFTAAHELGHIWRVDDFAVKRGLIDNTPDKREKIINRFAATLLIPEDDFRRIFKETYSKYENENGKITIINLIHIIVVLMNHFFVPEKAIICRLVELKYLQPNIADLLIGEASDLKEIIDNTVKLIIKNSGYVKFQKPSNKKWIKGLPELLERAENQNLVSRQKIDQMRELFGLSEASVPSEMEKEVFLNEKEENRK